MAASETYGDKRAMPLSGVYRHPDSGEELVVQATAKFGNPQADAIMRLGFVYVGPLSAKSDLTPAKDPSRKPIANTSPTLKSVSELEAELAQAKVREEAARKAAEDRSSLVGQPEAAKVAERNEQSAKDAKKEGAK